MKPSAWLRRPYAVLPLLLVVGLSACATEMAANEKSVIGDWGDESLYPELGGAYASLTPLVGSCTFVSTTGTMTIDGSNTAQTIIIGRRAVDSAILVNGDTCGSPAATSVTLKRLNVDTNMGNAQVVILDFIGGTFGAGKSGSVGINIDLGAGTDDLRIRGSSGVDTITFGADGASINTDTAKDVAIANVENYSVSLAAGADRFTGAGGYGTTGAFTTALVVYGGEGNDTITGGDGADEIYGGAGNDTLAGGAGADELYGEAGSDTMDMGSAADGGDTLDCGADADTVTYKNRTNAVTVTIGAGANDGESGENDDVDATCEGVVGGSGNDTLTGDSGDNTLSGGPGDDTLDGGDGDDVLNGDAGDDTFDEGTADNGSDTFNGGAGTDVVDYSGRTNDLTVTMNGTTADDGESGEGDNVKSDVEDIVGGDGDDNITGNNANNVIDGGDGDDTLSGGAGNDTFSQGSADDGSDTINGGLGVDTVDYSGRTNDLTVTMDGAAADDGESGEADDIKSDVEVLLAGDGDDDITGNTLDNVIEGGAGADTIDGDAGNDTLYGEAGNDDLTGGAGDDTLDGGAGDDDLTCGDGDDIAYNEGSGTRAADCEL